MKSIVGYLESIWRMEEMKATQRSRDMNIKEGDRNTTYFQVVANKRNIKNMTFGLEDPDWWIEDNSLMLDHVVDFYSKSLFSQEGSSEVKLG